MRSVPNRLAMEIESLGELPGLVVVSRSGRSWAESSEGQK